MYLPFCWEILRSNYTLERQQNHIGYHISVSLSSSAPKLWDVPPNSIKNPASLKEFKAKINAWIVDHYLCRYERNILGE